MEKTVNADEHFSYPSQESDYSVNNPEIKEGSSKRKRKHRGGGKNRRDRDREIYDDEGNVKPQSQDDGGANQLS